MFLIKLSQPDKPTVPQVYAMTLAAAYNGSSPHLQITPKELFMTLRWNAWDMVMGDKLLHQEHILDFTDSNLSFSITSIHNNSTLTIQYI